MPAPAAISLVIIDDNPTSLELLAAALGTQGIEILTASDPVEGLDLVFARHPQIVLTDLVMPRLSGRLMEYSRCHASLSAPRAAGQRLRRKRR